MNAEDGVFYPIEAYAGFWLRLAIELIDTFVVSGLCIGLSLVLVGFLHTAESLLKALLIGWLLIWFCYFVLLKHSTLSTIGYRIGNVKIVTLQGNNPSLYSLSLRLIFAVIGPLNLLLDLIWITSDPHRQSLRDKFAHTYVIKRDARVAGRGRIVYRTYSILGWH